MKNVLLDWEEYVQPLPILATRTKKWKIILKIYKEIKLFTYNKFKIFTIHKISQNEWNFYFLIKKSLKKKIYEICRF